AEEQAPAVVEEPTPSAPEVQEAPDAFEPEVESASAAQAAMEPPSETSQPVAPAYASEPEPAQESAPAPAADPGFIPATFVGEIPSATPQVSEESSGEGSAEETEQTFRLGGDPSIMVDFVSESKEHLDHASSQLLGLESNPDDEEAINSVFRAFHTIKGVAGFLQLKEIADLAHHTENLLDLVRKHEIQLTPALVDLSFEALDWMNRLIGNVARALGDDGVVRKEPDLRGVIARVQMAQTGTVIPPIAKSPAASASAPAATGGTASLGQMLVDKGAITERELEETIMDVEAEGSGKKIGEALVERGKVSAADVHQALRRQQEDRSSRKSVELKETIRVDYERLAGLIDTVGELVLAEAMISQDESLREVKSENLTKKLYNLRQVSRKLQEMGTTIRMVPIAGTFQKMARLVRDLSRKSGKPVNFVSHGDETELDRAYVDLIADPLVHMIRNSMDHGIEMPTERTQQGKPPTGEIILRAFHEGGNIHIEIKDDGKGLDTERIMKKAIERGLVQEGTEMTDQDIFQLIFEPGFSTAEKVTEVSGRGVGMDVVRRNIAELRGQVTISSEKGKGTVFRMILPLTMALIDGMLIRVGEQRFILPVLAVVESTRPTQAMVHTIVGKGEMISLRERQLPLYRLHRLLRINGAKEDATDALVVVVEYESKLYGLMVDELIGIQQTVIKGLDSTVFSTQGFSGSTIMGDGRVGLIIDIPGLLQIARNSADSLAS
ncbi:MAG: chemotaxis protein CheW, partial [Deltaproteobacteria bacterium]|nr:chemotaxis protein CheW [Deltaproteobacteria bacterium]